MILFIIFCRPRKSDLLIIFPGIHTPVYRISSLSGPGKQRHPGLPHPRRHLQLFQGESKVLPGQLRASPGPSLGPPPGERLPREASGTGAQATSAGSSLYAGGVQPPCAGTSFLSLVTAILTFQAPPKVHEQCLEWEHRLTCKSPDCTPNSVH